MNQLRYLCAAACVASLTTSCAIKTPSQLRYEAFKARSDYQKTHEVYREESILKTANQNNTVVKIDLSDQRAQLLVGKRQEVAIDLPCSTGKAGKRTPTGDFTIKQKITRKRSTIFGRLYRGRRFVYAGDRRRYRGHYTRFVGSSLPYWMRLTNQGIGMHYSRGVRRYACSNGCIRMPMESVKVIYSKTKVGTPVQITH